VFADGAKVVARAWADPQYKELLLAKGTAAIAELGFGAPWHSAVFALAAAVVEHAFGGDREPFRQQLIKAIAAQPGRPYWESWTTALEAPRSPNIMAPEAQRPDGISGRAVDRAGVRSMIITDALRRLRRMVTIPVKLTVRGAWRAS